MVRRVTSSSRLILFSVFISLFAAAPAFARIDDPPLPTPKPTAEELALATPVPAPSRSGASRGSLSAPLYVRVVSGDLAAETPALSRGPSWWSIALMLVLALSAAAIAGFAGWYVWLTRDAAQRRLRAYVGVRIVAPPSLEATWAQATVAIRNHGQTPALEVDHASMLVALDVPDGPVEAFLGSLSKSLGKMRIALAPGAEIHVPVRALLNDDERLELAQAEHKRLFAIGEVRYRDAFGKAHFTTFNFVFGGGNDNEEWAAVGNAAS